MKPRPKSVTVICWIIIVFGLLSVFPIMTNMNNPKAIEIMSRSPLPMSVQYGVMYLTLLLTLLSGIGMLYGKNWARLLYVGWSILGFIIAFATSPMKVALIPGILIFVVIIFFLFRPKANAFFSGATEQ